MALGGAHIPLPVAGVRRTGNQKRFHPGHVAQEGREKRHTPFPACNLGHLLLPDATNQFLLLQSGQHPRIGGHSGPPGSPTPLLDRPEDLPAESAGQAWNITGAKRRLEPPRVVSLRSGRLRTPHFRRHGGAHAPRPTGRQRDPFAGGDHSGIHGDRARNPLAPRRAASRRHGAYPDPFGKTQAIHGADTTAHPSGS